MVWSAHENHKFCTTLNWCRLSVTDFCVSMMLLLAVAFVNASLFYQVWLLPKQACGSGLHFCWSCSVPWSSMPFSSEFNFQSKAEDVMTDSGSWIQSTWFQCVLIEDSSFLVCFSPPCFKALTNWQISGTHWGCTYGWKPRTDGRKSFSTNCWAKTNA